jgi:exodeoxyribonuclease VII large subunit
LRNRLRRGAEYRLLMARKHTIELTQHAAFGSIRQLLNRRQQKLDDLRIRLLDAHRGTLRGYRTRLDIAAAHLRARDLRVVMAGIRRELEHQNSRRNIAIARLLHTKGGALTSANGRLSALSPVAILDRGYALVFDATGKLVRDSGQVTTGDEISVRLAKGALDAEVKKSRR